MMTKFWYLTKYGLKKKFKSKSFIISNIIIFLLLLVVFNIDTIISLFGGDFENSTNIYVVDNTNESFDLFKANYETLKMNISDSISQDEIINSNKTTEELKEEIKDTLDIIIELNTDEANYLKANIRTMLKYKNS